MGSVSPALILAACLSCPAGAGEVMAERPGPVKPLAPQSFKLAPQLFTPGLAGALQAEIDLFRGRLLSYPRDALTRLRARAEGQEAQGQAARLILGLIYENGRVAENGEVLREAIGAVHLSKLRRASNMLHNNSPGLLEQARLALDGLPAGLEAAPVAEALQAGGKVFDGSAVSKPAVLAEEAKPVEKPAALESPLLSLGGGIVRVRIQAKDGKVFESRGGRVILKDAGTGEALREFNTGPVRRLIFDKKGNRLFALGTGANHAVTAFDAATGEILGRFEKGSLPIEGFALAKSGKKAYVADYRQRVWAWDLETGGSILAARLDRRKFMIKRLWDSPRHGLSALARKMGGRLYLYRDGSYTLARPRSRERLPAQPSPRESPAVEAQQESPPIEAPRLTTGSGDAPKPLDLLLMSTIVVGVMSYVLANTGHMAAALGTFVVMVTSGLLATARRAPLVSAAKDAEAQAAQRLRAMRERLQTLKKRVESVKGEDIVAVAFLLAIMLSTIAWLSSL